jgi:hypothetical protein
VSVKEVAIVDPLMRALLDRLPAPGTAWPLDERMLWLAAAESAINLIYGAVEKIDISSFLPVRASHAELDKVARQPITHDQNHRAKSEFVGLVDNGNGTASEVSISAEDVAALGGAGAGAPAEPTGTDTADRETPVQPPTPKVTLPPLKKNVGGAPSKVGRPAGLPTNKEMAHEAIVALDGRASAPQIRDWLRKKYWSGMPDHWIACLYDMGLARDGINFVSKAQAKIDSVLPNEPSRVPMPAVKPTAGPRAPAPGKKFGPPSRGPHTATFKHGDRECTLQSSREYVLAGKLRAAMGKGHVSEGFLAENVMSSNTEHNRQMVRAMCLGMNDALAGVGLSIGFYPGFGLLMKEVDVG